MITQAVAIEAAPILHHITIILFIKPLEAWRSFLIRLSRHHSRITLPDRAQHHRAHKHRRYISQPDMKTSGKSSKQLPASTSAIEVLSFMIASAS